MRTTIIHIRLSTRKLMWLIMPLLFLSTSCKKFVTVEAPKTTVNEENVYHSDQTAIAVLTGLYASMANDGRFTGRNSISLMAGLSADELSLASIVTDARLLAYYKNQLRTNPNENYGTELWSGGAGEGNLFNYLFICNSAIEGISRSESLTASVKNQLLGEARFMRAFFNFYLVNFFGDIPLVLTTNPGVNVSLSRTPVPQVYQQIVEDLKEAQQLLSDYYPNKDLQSYSGTPERVRPTNWAATALLARTYLYMADYANAEAESSKVIGNSMFALANLNTAFLKNSTEAIWQLQPVLVGRNTEDAFAFILPISGPNATVNTVYLSPQVLDAFEPGDLRRQGGNWVDSVIVSGNTYFFPFKYKATTSTGSATEYLSVFRLAEQYLIRAEARARQDNVNGAQSDLNAIRTRAGLSNTAAGDQASLLTAILKERQVELFTEFAHRWLDLKRTVKVDEVMSDVTPLKANGTGWQSYQQLYPVLYNDILKDPNLVQNPGY